MKYRVAIWTIVGLLVAGGWALVAAVAFPTTNEVIRNLRTLVSVTCPIAILGRHHPINFYEAVVANATTYGCIGLITETLRKLLHHTL